jgi:threonine dehydratase
VIDVPTYDDVCAAAERIAGIAHRTPVMHSRLIDAMIGAEMYFKCENLQRIGAFKFRGAYNALSRLTLDQKRAGVVAYSSGNHAQAVALSARLLGISATLVMPYDAPASKVAATRSYGATVINYDRYTQERESVAAELAGDRGLVLIPPFDHPHIIAGQGTAAKELLEDVPGLDALLVPLGGGGLLSGSALSATALAPDCVIYGSEPAEGNDGYQSLQRGSIVTIETPETIADGAQTTSLGIRPFEIIRETVEDVVTPADDDLVHAMRLCATYLKQVVEPTGALGLAGAWKLAPRLRGQRVGVLISGGNIDLDRYASLIKADTGTG